MPLDLISMKETKNIIPIPLENKERYYLDLTNIEQSLTGRVDAGISHIFIEEATQLIVNSIILFEKGYADCSFYSLRQSLELSTTITYLIELSPKDRNEKLNEWIKQSKFPMYGETLQYLRRNKGTFSDMLKHMSSYFKQLELVKSKLNKHVHKQGFNNFYVSSDRYDALNKSDYISNFEEMVDKCIGAIAVLRLSIDPMPILLMDPDINMRLSGMLTDPYTEEFVSKYIGVQNIKLYKQTNLYQDYYAAFIKEEKKFPSVLNLLEFKFIDRNESIEYQMQLHLLSIIDIYAITIGLFSVDIAHIYVDSGWDYYFTNTKSLRRRSSTYLEKDLIQIKNSKKSINYKYDEIYLSYIKVSNFDFFIEHNKPFDKCSLDELSAKLNGL